MRGEHRVAAAGQQDLHAPDVGAVDVGPDLQRHRLRLAVGALAQPDPRPGDRQVPAVTFGAVQVGLQHRAGVREVDSQSAAEVSRVRSVVVWSSMSSVTVVPASAAASQIGRALSVAIASPSPESAWPTAESLTETSAPVVEPGIGEPGEDPHVGARGLVRLLSVEGVLAEVVEGDRETRVLQVAGGAHRVVVGLPGREAGDDVTDARGRRHRVLDRLAGREGEERSAHHHEVASARPVSG